MNVLITMRMHLRKVARCRRGGILTLTIITLPVILLITALCVDLGMIYLAKEKTLMAATSAADAAAQRYPDIESAKNLSSQVALTTMSDTGFLNSYEILTDFENGMAIVSVEIETKTILARFADVHFLKAISVVEVRVP